jgi:hypothetical protein
MLASLDKRQMTRKTQVVRHIKFHHSGLALVSGLTHELWRMGSEDNESDFTGEEILAIL